MLKLFNKLLILCLGVLIIVTGVSKLYMLDIQETNKHYSQMPYGITLANTGSSHGVHAFDYDVYSDVAFNFALDSQSLEYDYNILDYYIEHFSEKSVLLIPISYFSFWSDELKGDSFDAKNKRYLSILDVDHMRFKNEKDYYLYKYFYAIQIADQQIMSVFKEMNSPEKNPQKSDYSIEEVGEKRAAYHMRNIQNVTRISEVNPKAIEAVLNLISLCNKHSITPVLITTPYMSYYSKWMSDEFLQEFYSQIYAIQNDMGVVYLDYSKDEHFLNKEDLFIDTDHLNEDGARIFTGIVIQDLEELGLIII